MKLDWLDWLILGGYVGAYAMVVLRGDARRQAKDSDKLRWN